MRGAEVGRPTVALGELSERPGSVVRFGTGLGNWSSAKRAGNPNVVPVVAGHDDCEFCNLKRVNQLESERRDCYRIFTFA